MLPLVSIIGRSNVGKSTLFNCLTASKAALVYDLPGTTRDRNYKLATIQDHTFTLVDSAGIDLQTKQDNLILDQVTISLEQADLVLFVVDAQAGVTSEDLILAKNLRKFNKPIIVVMNKIDGINLDLVTSEFYLLGFKLIVPVAAKMKRGINNLKNHLCQTLLHLDRSSQAEDDSIVKDDSSGQINGIKVALVGQPNVGKSTLINKILGEDRLVVLDLPGTTRDSIYIDTKIGHKNYVLIDTAGIRRRARIKESLEKFAVIKTLDAINAAQVVVLLIDAIKGVVEQDLKLMDYIIAAGRSVVIAINKWDLISPDARQKLLKKLTLALDYFNFIDIVVISALHGSGIMSLFRSISQAYTSALLDVATHKLSALLQQAVKEHQPPVLKGRRIKLRYAHLGGHLPFKVIIHGTQVEDLPLSYKKYLSNFYRENLKLQGTGVHITCKNADNPYKLNN